MHLKIAEDTYHRYSFKAISFLLNYASKCRLQKANRLGYHSDMPAYNLDIFAYAASRSNQKFSKRHPRFFTWKRQSCFTSLSLFCVFESE